MKRALIFLLCAVLLCRTHAARAETETYSLADDIFRRIHGVVSRHADEIQIKTSEVWNDFLNSSDFKEFSVEVSGQSECGWFSEIMTELEREIKQHIAVSFHSAAASMEKGSFSERLAGALFETIAQEMAADIAEEPRDAGKNSPSGKKVPATPVFKPDKLIPQSE